MHFHSSVISHSSTSSHFVYCYKDTWDSGLWFPSQYVELRLLRSSSPPCMSSDFSMVPPVRYGFSHKLGLLFTYPNSTGSLYVPLLRRRYDVYSREYLSLSLYTSETRSRLDKGWWGSRGGCHLFRIYPRLCVAVSIPYRERRDRGEYTRDPVVFLVSKYHPRLFQFTLST